MSTVYHIKNWDDHFENAKSRERKDCSFVCMPNKQDGLGLTRILAETDGAAIFGVWCLILQACSRQVERDGWLTVDGYRTGSPWVVDDLAVRWRRTPQEIQRTLDFVCSSKVGWMEKIEQECPPGTRAVPAQYPSGALEGKGREEKEKKGREGSESTATNLNSSIPFPATTPPPAERLRAMLTRYGAKLEMAGKNIFPEWMDVCKGYKIGWIEKIFSDGCQPALPSDMRRILKSRRATYDDWQKNLVAAQ